MAFIKPIKERGIVISKTYKEAKAERVDFQGRKWPATEEKYIVEVVSWDSGDFNNVTGIPNGTRANYEVSKELYEQLKFGMWVDVKYTASQFGEKLTIKTESLSLAK